MKIGILENYLRMEISKRINFWKLEFWKIIWELKFGKLNWKIEVLKIKFKNRKFGY